MLRPQRQQHVTGNGGRSQAIRRIHRLPGGAPHLGSEPASASPSALHRARRRHLARWLALDSVPQGLLLSSLSPPQPALPQEILAPTASSLPSRPPALHRPPPTPGFARRIRGPV